MQHHDFIFSLYIIFSGAAVLATIALMTRQAMLIAYMILGVLLGPWGLKIVGDAQIITGVGNIGIIFLLFLLGLHLPPQKLFHVFQKVFLVTFGSSVIFGFIGYLLAYFSHFGQVECVIIGAAMMFSSTIIGIKLLPTSVLHYQHIGELMVGVLLLQDVIAIIVLLLMHGAASISAIVADLKNLMIGLPLILGFAFLFQRYVLVKLFSYFSHIKEYIFLVAIAWCLSMTVLTEHIGLSAEIGAFIAGVSLATSPIAFYIAERLNSVRDFCLVLFFFSIGANFNWHYLSSVIFLAFVLALILLLVKPIVYRLFLRNVSESKHVSWEIGFRLDQVSEFSLIISYVGLNLNLITNRAAYLIQAVTMITLIISSYLVIFRYPTPVAMSEELRRE